MILDTGHSANFEVVVRVADVDISAQLTGRIKISGAKDSSRIASLSVIPPTPDDLNAYKDNWIEINIILSRGVISEIYRLFSGTVTEAPFDAFSQVAALECRDAYSEIRKVPSWPKENMENLFNGLAYPSAILNPWNETTPDPGAYFDGLLETLLGSTFVDSMGEWQCVPWTIGVPAVSFTDADIHDGSFDLTRSVYSELPNQIKAVLVHRITRLHNIEVDLLWERVDRSKYVTDGVPTLPKATIQAALAGASDWYVRGAPVLTQPIPGAYPVIVGGQTVMYAVAYGEAQLTCDQMSATMYRRWYQEVDVRYSVTFDIGGASDTITVSENIAGDFDAAAWERASATQSSNGIYYANSPVPEVEATGYEALPQPWPPANAAIDHMGTQTAADVQQAFDYVVAKAMRQAAIAKRRQTIKFSREIDPRFEIGSVIGVAAYGVSAIGQVDEFEYDIDLDSADASVTWTLAVPDGTGETTGFAVTVAPPEPDVYHYISPIGLGNHIGASYDTPAVPDDTTLVGFLCNTLPTSDNYDASKPVYNTQFRLILPEITAADRDPIIVDVEAAGTWSICNGSLGLDF